MGLVSDCGFVSVGQDEANQVITLAKSAATLYAARFRRWPLEVSFRAFSGLAVGSVF